LGLGSNLGNRLANLKSARSGLALQVRLLRASPVYETPPMDYQSQPVFLNQVIEGETQLHVLTLLDFLKRLELQLGRQPNVRYGARSIDIDILFYDDMIYESRGLFVPHKRVHERAFMLAPLADLVPDMMHPVQKRTIKELLQKCDQTGISVYEP